MTFVSYAQNFEDVILWRALKHVEKGFYIDVGANDPNRDSVTKAFYDREWRGINIEPISQWFEKLEQDRPRDINLQVAAGTEAGELKLYELPDTGLSTIDSEFAERHRGERGFEVIERTVSVRTLSEICAAYHVAPIHFLKIDVEGAEKQVLGGIDFSVVRPWIVVVESTLPNSQVEDFEGWEPLLTESGYEFVYFDGLNRFYVAAEHQELKPKFGLPPNYFDDFSFSGEQIFCQVANRKAAQFLADLEASLQRISEEKALQSNELHAAHEKIQSMQYQLGELWDRAQQLQISTDHLSAVASKYEKELHGVYSSRSWLITWPLRKVGGAAKWLVRLPKRAIRWGLVKLMSLFLGWPIIRIPANSILRRFPQFHAKLHLLARARGLEVTQGSGDGFGGNEAFCVNSSLHLAPGAQQIYRDLKAGLEQRQDENT